MALRETSSECGLLVKAMRQLTQSVNVVVSVSAWGKRSEVVVVGGGANDTLRARDWDWEHRRVVQGQEDGEAAVLAAAALCVNHPPVM